MCCILHFLQHASILSIFNLADVSASMLTKASCTNFINWEYTIKDRMHHCILKRGIIREKGRDLTQFYARNLTHTEEKSKKQGNNITNATENFDNTKVADRFRTVSWSSNSHPTVWLNRYTSAQPPN